MLRGYITIIKMGSNNLDMALASNLVQKSTTYNLCTIMTKDISWCLLSTKSLTSSNCMITFNIERRRRCDPA